MFAVSSVLFALFALSTAQQQQQQPINFTHSEVLDPNGNFIVNWLPAANDNDYFIFECEVATKGWLGFGFSSNGAMAAADIVIAWIDASGTPQISDRHGPAQGNGYPPADTTQNYELLSGRKNSTHTVVTFRRKQDTCDPQDWKITSDTTRLIWAYNDQLPTSADDIQQHTQRGVHSAQLINPQTKDGMSQILADPNTKTFDLRVSNVTLPTDQRTLYWCEVVELPKWNKHHVIANRMMVQKGNERHVHHLVMYGCRDTDMSKYLGKPADCFHNTIGLSPMNLCNDYRAVWAVGGEDFVYPSNMGAPIFEDPNERFVLLEMHYDNPDLTPGITDSSAFRLYVTEKLRPIETGRFTVGLPVSAAMLAIPPNQPRFTAYTYCPSQCTQALTQPMNVFTGLLHTHLLGVAVKVRVIRNGTEIKSGMKDDHYDFNYQTPVYLAEPLVLMPGDDLIIECTFDSTSRSTTSYGGYGTDQEMCLAMMEYYPKRNHTSETCMSFVDSTAMLQVLGLNKNQIAMVSDGSWFGTASVLNENNQNVTVDDWYTNDLKMTDNMATNLQNFMKTSPQSVICGMERNPNQVVNSTGSGFQLYSPIPVARPYVDPPSVCNASSGTTQPIQATVQAIMDFVRNIINRG